MIGIIYKYTSPNNKIYIGQTIQGDLRKQQHKQNANNENYIGYHLPFYNAIRKYGFDSFKYEILNSIEDKSSEIVQSRLNELEIYYIGFYDSYNNGYNSTIGGQGISGIQHPSCKKVIQYDLDGNFITTFESGSLAAKTLGLKDASVILKCCNFKVKSSGGFQWRFFNLDFIEKIEPLKKRKENSIKYYGKDNKQSKTVYQYSLDKIFIKEWNSLSDIKRELGYDDGNICKVCNGKLPYYGKKNCEKYIWSYIKLQ